MLDLPVNQEGENAAQQNDHAQNAKLAPLAHDDGAQYLAAHLEFERQRDTLSQLQPDAGIPFYPVKKASCGCLLYTSDAADDNVRG